MVREARGRRLQKPQRESGFTLLETLVAATILLIVIAGILPAFVFGVQVTQQAGDTATRTTEYAQDKMEQLIAVPFNDPGLGGAMGASTTVGAVPPSGPASGYVDYTDVNGNILGSSTGADYTRQWSIATDSTGNLKTITVVVKSLSTGATGAAPTTTVVCIKANNL